MTQAEPTLRRWRQRRWLRWRARRSDSVRAGVYLRLRSEISSPFLTGPFSQPCRSSSRAVRAHLSSSSEPHNTATCQHTPTTSHSHGPNDQPAPIMGAPEQREGG